MAGGTEAAVRPWPFKRDVYALVIEQLRDLGARAVAIDLLLADSGVGDAALARVQARPGAPVLLAAAGMRHASDGALPPADPAAAAGAASAVSTVGTLAKPAAARLADDRAAGGERGPAGACRSWA
ncbi:MAG: CHASE2 domain-containing protein [Rubrivivax sp.]